MDVKQKRVTKVNCKATIIVVNDKNLFNQWVSQADKFFNKLKVEEVYSNSETKKLLNLMMLIFYL